MADIVEIKPEDREKIEPYLRQQISEHYYPQIDDMFAQVVYTYPDGIPLVALNPCGEFPSMQFLTTTGEFAELTSWDYIVNVDVEAQIQETEEKRYWELVASVLEYYHRIDFRATADYERTARNRTVNDDATEEYGETIYEYNCPMQTIYLTEDHYPVSYGEQYVDEEQEWYMYNFNDELDVTDLYIADENSDNFEYKIPYEWKREEISDA